MKSKSMLGRMLSKYNTRYFVLDVKKGLFYYMVDKNSSVSTARQIPINAIESVSVDTNPQVSADEKTWKHGITIKTKKKDFNIIAPSELIMEKFLYGFGSLIDDQTKQPLFNWNAYKISEIGSVKSGGVGKIFSKDEVFSNHGDGVASPKPASTVRSHDDRGNDEGNTSVKKSPSQTSVPYGQAQEGDEVKIRFDEDENKIAKHFTLNSKSPVSFRPRGNAEDDPNIKTHENIDYNYRVGIYDKQASDQEKQLYERESQKSQVGESAYLQVDGDKREQESSRKSAPYFEVSDHSARVSIQNGLHVLAQAQGQGQSKGFSSQIENNSLQPINQANSKYNSEVAASKDGNKDFLKNSGVSLKNSQTKSAQNDEKSEFLGVNQLDISQPERKGKSISILEDENFLAEKASNNLNRTKHRLSKNMENPRKMHIGNGVMVSMPRFEETYEKQDLPISYINMMQEAKRCSMLVTHGEYIRGDFKKNRSGMTRNLIVDEEEWERELFGDDDNDKSQSMKRMDVSANKELGPPSQHLSEGRRTIISDNLMTYENRSGRSKKPGINHKQSEMFASREDYNDWEDL